MRPVEGRAPPLRIIRWTGTQHCQSALEQAGEITESATSRRSDFGGERSGSGLGAVTRADRAHETFTSTPRSNRLRLSDRGTAPVGCCWKEQSSW